MDDRLKELLKSKTEDFFRIFEEKEMDQWIDLWAEDSVNRAPYASGMFPEKLIGKEEIYKNFASTAENFDRISFIIHEIIVDEAAKITVAKLDGKLAFKVGGFYENSYVFIFHFDGNYKIKECFEYFNPFIAGKAFGLLNKLKNN